MEKIERYRTYIKQLLTEYASLSPSDGEAETEIIFDTERDRYQVVHTGWKNRRCLYGCVLHLDIKAESLGLGMVKLVGESERKAKELAKQLAARAKEQLAEPAIQAKVLQFIQTVVAYKFPQLSRKEIEAMLSLDLLKGTKVYEEIYEEGKVAEQSKLIAKLLQRGMSLQEVAELLDLDEETVRKAAP